MYKFREISKGSDMFPSLAYDEVSDVVVCGLSQLVLSRSSCPWTEMQKQEGAACEELANKPDDPGT